MDLYLKAKSNDTPREAAEKKLADEFLSILQRHHSDIRTSLEDGISVAERKILSRTSYQNWTLGLTAGAVTFGVLMGVTLRSAAAAARYQLPKRAPLSYRDFDATTGGAASRQIQGAGAKRDIPGIRRQVEEPLNIPVGQATEAMDPTSLQGEVMSQGTCPEGRSTVNVMLIRSMIQFSFDFLWYFTQSNT